MSDNWIIVIRLEEGPSRGGTQAGYNIHWARSSAHVVGQLWQQTPATFGPNQAVVYRWSPTSSDSWSSGETGDRSGHLPIADGSAVGLIVYNVRGANSVFTRQIINYSESSKLSTGCQEHLHKYDTKRVVRSCTVSCRHLHVPHNDANLQRSPYASLTLTVSLCPSRSSHNIK